MGKTTVAPYMYLWGKDPQYYKTTQLSQVKTGAVTMAFVISRGVNEIMNWVNNGTPSQVMEFFNWTDEFKTFSGLIILSLGGANGPYIEADLDVQQEYSFLKKIVTDVGIKYFDFDIEGSNTADTGNNTKRAQALVLLQKDFSDVKVSLTLPVAMPHPEWSSAGGLEQSCLDLIKSYKSLGVKIDRVNCMTMDYYASLPSGKTWGGIACEIGDQVKNQIGGIYTGLSEPALYQMVGITPMIGTNDDTSVFSVDDMKTVCNYCKQKGIGLLSFWSINRDQVGSGNLSIYTGVNRTNLEFTNVAISILGNGNEIPDVIVTPPPAEGTSGNGDGDGDGSISVPPVVEIPSGSVSPPPASGLAGKRSLSERIKLITKKIKAVVTKGSSGPKVPSESKIPEWDSAKSYSVGDKVTYKMAVYKCLTAHTSISTWTPEYAPSLWAPSS